MKQTAVEWLQEQYNNCPKYEAVLTESDFKQAKELEKQQMKAIWSESYENMRKTFGTSNYTPIDFEEYYNENYN